MDWIPTPGWEDEIAFLDVQRLSDTAKRTPAAVHNDGSRRRLRCG